MSKIIKEYRAKQVKEGAGVIVNRIFGYYETPEFDPFLMLDYFETKEQQDSPGFPWHPHKGIETITYFTRGAGEHQDNFGNKGVIGAGELQWMTAGKGIFHQETPVTSKDGYQGFQFWLNLPKAQKLVEPAYKYIKKGDMKSHDQDGLKVRVIAGEYEGIVGPIDKSNLGLKMFHISLEKDKEIVLSRSQGMQGYIFVFEGEGKSNQDSIRQIAAYKLDEGEFTIKATSSKLEFIFAEGIPINEPIFWKGPIVMNSREEIEATFKDLREGTF